MTPIETRQLKHGNNLHTVTSTATVREVFRTISSLQISLVPPKMWESSSELLMREIDALLSQSAWCITLDDKISGAAAAKAVNANSAVPAPLNWENCWMWIFWPGFAILLKMVSIMRRGQENRSFKLVERQWSSAASSPSISSALFTFFFLDSVDLVLFKTVPLFFELDAFDFVDFRSFLSVLLLHLIFNVPDPVLLGHVGGVLSFFLGSLSLLGVFSWFPFPAGSASGSGTSWKSCPLLNTPPDPAGCCTRTIWPRETSFISFEVQLGDQIGTHYILILTLEANTWIRILWILRNLKKYIYIYIDLHMHSLFWSLFFATTMWFGHKRNKHFTYWYWHQSG